MKDKRGEELGIWFITEIFAAAFVVYILVSAAESYGSYGVFDQMRLSRKLAMEINAINSVNGNAYLVNNDALKYNIRLNKERVDVFEEGKEILKSSYTYVGGDNSLLDSSLNKPVKLILMKESGRVVADTDVREGFGDRLLSLNTKDEGWRDRIILIDPGHGGDPNNPRRIGDAGYVNNGLKESVIVFEIANSLSQLMGNIRLTRSSEDNPGLAERINQISISNPEIIIILHAGSKNDDSNEVIAYINHESEKGMESRKLALLILKEMSQKLDVTDTKISSLLMEDLENEDPKRILDNDKIAVYLEIGNIKSRKGNEMLNNNIPQIVISIKNAIYKYFS